MATNASVKLCVPSPGRIATIESLREHLQWAIELEHFTVPPYLCALYSVDADRNTEVKEVLVSIFLEEMLHMTLVGNLLNAIGGSPRLDTPANPR
jgi:rubrerythrin